MRPRHLFAVSLACASGAFADDALAATYRVGPNETHTQLTPLMRDVLQPGDVVEVEGDATYDGDLVLWGGNWPGAMTGTAEQPITIRGIRKNGKRPVIRGGGEWGIVLYMNWSIFEGFEVEGGTMAAIVHKGHNVTIRDVLVRDCGGGQGILGTDGESGSLLLEHSEVRNCGDGVYRHSIYIAGDEVMYPGHVFRMQHCYVHSALGGNLVKSRAERNEIHYNWLEGALYHELDLIGPVDPVVEGLAREDSEIVGNVIIKAEGNTFGCLRAGGDGNLSTYGRYRMVNNTCVLSSESRAPFFLQYELESLELRNNVFTGGAPGARLALMVDGADAPIGGSHNYFADQIELATSTGSVVDLTDNLRGSDPGFVSLASFDLRPSPVSLLVDAGVDPVPTWDAYPFPNPLTRPAFLPPPRGIPESMQPVARALVGALDLGALEHGVDPGSPGEGGGQSGDGTGGAGLDDRDMTVGEPSPGCDCRATADGRTPASSALLALGMAAIAAMRRKSRTFRRPSKY
jgi:MYXO-CTERM domain-containing protein